MNLTALTLLLLFTLPAPAAVSPSEALLKTQTQVDTELAELLPAAKSPAALLGKLGPFLDPATSAHLNELVKGNEDSSLKVDKGVDGTFVIYTSGKETSFAFLKFDEMGEFALIVDNKKIEFHPTDETKKFRDEILSAIPNSNNDRPSLRAPNHPDRHSRRGFVTMAGAVYRLNKVNCAYQKSMLDWCGNKKTKEADLKLWADYARKWSKASLGCDDHKAPLKACLKKSIAARKIAVSPEAEAYLK